MAAERLLVLTYWGLNDALIQTYTLPYLRIIRSLLPEGSSIHLVTFERDEVPEEEKLIERDIYHFAFRQFPFGLKAILARLKNTSLLGRFIEDKKITTIHTWCTTAGALGWRLSKRTGLPLILDSYEPHAEAMVETGTWKRNSIAFRLLFWMEKKQTHHAKWLIGVVPGMKDYAREKYGYRGENFLFKPACINTDEFSLSKRNDVELKRSLGLENKIVCVYVGKFGGLYLTDEVFRFFAVASAHWGKRFQALLLTSATKEEIAELSERHGVHVVSLFVPHREIPRYSGIGDFAFSAFKPVPSRRYCTPIKNGEYWAMGLPVIIPAGISEDSDIISATGTGYVLRDLSEGEMLKAVQEMDVLLEENKEGRLSEKIHNLAVKYRNFKIAEDVYKKIYQK